MILLVKNLKYSQRTAILILVAIFGISFQSYSQKYWIREKPFSLNELGEPRTVTKSHTAYSLNLIMAKGILSLAPQEIETTQHVGTYGVHFDLPMGGERLEEFSVITYEMMEKGLQEQFPQIKTFIGQSIRNPQITARIDLTDHGFHAMIVGDGETKFIDPWRMGDDTHYQLYTKSQVDEKAKGVFQEFETGQSPLNLDKSGPTNELSIFATGTQRRSYRLALSATAEYTAFQGGTISLALSAMTTTMNRVNGVYEKDVAIRMTLIANTNLLIYTNSVSDPFTNGDAFAMLDENQTSVTLAIGSANYDIGHVFGTNSGGVALLGCVCGSSKAQGVTGSGSPSGDAFDIDYVAHEIGHQFGANHTFNSITGSCSVNRASTRAFEPGSGTTIMAYAGICGADNIQSNSNAYFHFGSYEEIITFSVSGSGNTCASIASTGNTPPSVSTPTGGFTIPKSTPFSLTATGSDVNGDAITYCWEESDLGPAGSPNSPSGTAPIFRSFSPNDSPSRTFPRLSDILSNSQTLGEIQATTARTLSFKVMARDNRANGGGANLASLSFSVSGTAGPFLITSPNTVGTGWIATNVATVSWNVSGTSSAPINCQNVKILLSLDGGQTFNITLAANTPNDGNQAIVVPNNPTTQARVKVESVGNIFFDISDVNFIIAGSAGVVATPVISPTGGTFSNGGVNITISCATANAAIYFTTNGNVHQPGTTFTKEYGGPFAMTVTGTIRAFATKSGFTNSAVAVANYTIISNGTVATPLISPGTGTYPNAQTIFITCATSGASILYTTNGNVPLSGTTYTKIYSGPFIQPGTGTVRAIATKSGLTSSAVVVAFFTITTPSIVATPIISPGGGTFSGPQNVTISCATAGATIYYTTNGNEPNPGTSFTKVYSVPFSIPATTTVRALGRKTDLAQSTVAVANFTITTITVVATPVIFPGTGSFSGPQNVTLTCATSGATIYYTTSGNNPVIGTSFTKVYTGPFIVTGSTTVRAMGAKTGLSNSSIAVSYITITGGAARQSVDKESPKPSEASQVMAILWPNPGKGQIHINHSEIEDGKVWISVKNALGSEVYRTSVLFEEGRSELDLRHLRDGVYFVELNCRSKRSMLRMIKQ